ncbi:MAG: site-specific integrase [Acidithiobacillus caldus]|uniref:Integrase n=1 Tax=Acidithiobacillus caldus TaxID=33059 RepID=A0A1E7YN44_9PROT|nr:site-specific integrase [Acidithiobacillus caldus]OFC35400.1 integrase [Acidithiobacillus caldus]OFC37317.1 integrase [Acidithiobacillus caldus]OFC39597.1 integrase [Acidithiobacillus caldus]WMT47207.1 MAG: site-specific integrase [Acidithiobacillus caldus]
MASIRPSYDREGEHIGWQVSIRKKGFPPQYRTFRTRREAEAWAAIVESEMVRGVWQDRSEAERTTVGELLDRYAREVLPTLKGGYRELSRVAVLKTYLGMYSLAALSSSQLARYRDARLSTDSRRGGKISPQTVKHEMALLQRALKKGVQEWGLVLPAGLPTALVKPPKLPQARDRRLVGDEEARLLAGCAQARNPWLLPVVRFAIETAMRAGEMLETKGTADPETGERPIQTTGLLWKHVDLKKRTATLPMTKNGTARVVPLSSVAVSILKDLPRPLDGRVFGTTYEAIHLSFTRACQRTGIDDLRFHDLRHEATSRLFEKGLNPMQVAAITGHKTLQMLKRYTHLRAEDLARLLG